ncbi:hypothetical protein Q5H92_03905 [Hymenobacter sp. M29]|uniref:DUF4177 domain-containing protein n=1 Tax=Hymenobacter mellowenesis TaxID=3063995 RepID=A0ABT9A6M8_9BACT|nr:hypothetical protein [Hymenobacter sp. M29]MDO7845490.1 hypothetical protein [Hymenobacter sp. M29]
MTFISFQPAARHSLRRIFVLFGLVAGLSLTAHAQTAPPRAYEFMTMSTFESQAKALSHILLAPPFQGKADIQLEDFGGFSTSKNLDKYQRNALLVTQQLEALTAAGWELVHVYPVSEVGVLTTRYLFRKAK